MWNNLTEEDKYWSEWLWKWVESIRLKLKGNVHKYGTQVEKVVSYGSMSW